MERNGIPTAGVYGVCETPGDACAKLDSVTWPVVVKADGLCAGKGVLVTSSASEAKEFIQRVMVSHEFGEAGARVLLEEGLVGKELSYIVLTDGKQFYFSAPTRDHKRAFDNDEGPNTGGMGTYSTDGMLTRELEEEILATIVRPTLAGLRRERMQYRGFIFFGLMLTKDGPKVLEYNCRLGDPETQAILLRADFDFAAACMDAATGKLDAAPGKMAQGSKRLRGDGVRRLSGKPRLGKVHRGLDEAEKVPHAAVFHAGTRRRRRQLLHKWWTNFGSCRRRRVARGGGAIRLRRS